MTKIILQILQVLFQGEVMIQLFCLCVNIIHLQFSVVTFSIYWVCTKLRAIFKLHVERIFVCRTMFHSVQKSNAAFFFILCYAKTNLMKGEHDLYHLWRQGYSNIDRICMKHFQKSESMIYSFLLNLTDFKNLLIEVGYLFITISYLFMCHIFTIPRKRIVLRTTVHFAHNFSHGCYYTTHTSSIIDAK